MILLSVFEDITKIEFWEKLFESFANLGPLLPIFLAMIESIIPALPLVAIVAINVAAHGPLLGFLYSWGGSCLGCTIVFFFFRCVFKKLTDKIGKDKMDSKINKARKVVSDFDVAALFLILCLPFTPSSFMNFAFGISNFSAKKYLITLFLAKVLMIGSLAIFGASAAEAMSNPWVLIPAVALMALLYWISVKVRKRHKLD